MKAKALQKYYNENHVDIAKSKKIALAPILEQKEKSKIEKKIIGQFFTNQDVANYMASMIDCKIIEKNKTVKILDAGAGEGILAISTIKFLLNEGYNKFDVHLYEIDDQAVIALENNIKKTILNHSSDELEIKYCIYNEDYILDRSDQKEMNGFDVVIINPPYFKYNTKSSIYSDATKDLFKGNPNIYASFMAVSISSLKQNGQMISITPRSFTNGLYFKGFRDYLLSLTSIEHIHIFSSRGKLFGDNGVLQENIICRLVKKPQSKFINISSSECYLDLDKSVISEYSANILINTQSTDNIIRIPETDQDAKIIEFLEKLPSNFSDNGYFISTGPVVEHRTREYINSKENVLKIPLLRMHNAKPFGIEFSGNHKKDAFFCLRYGYEKFIQENKVYVLLKRFSSKDEKRRLTASINNPAKMKFESIAIENHINYIGIKNGNMGLDEAYGISALFNSTIMDRYFRSVSGSTQVNATEIRMMKLPDRKKIKFIGQKIMNLDNFTQDGIDIIVNQNLM